MIRTYSILSTLKTFDQRYEYLRLSAKVGESAFGFDRYLNQTLYSSREWRRIRDKIIVRDEGCDLGHPEYEINGKIIVHHINPLTMQDLENGSDKVFDLEGLVCVSHHTHLAIHFGNSDLLPKLPVARVTGDTNLWKETRRG